MVLVLRVLFADARVAAEGLQPIRLGQMLPAEVSGGEETLLVGKRAHTRQLRGPGTGAAAGENFRRCLIVRQRMPMRQHWVQANRPSRNSCSRLPATWSR